MRSQFRATGGPSDRSQPERPRSVSGRDIHGRSPVWGSARCAKRPAKLAALWQVDMKAQHRPTRCGTGRSADPPRAEHRQQHDACRGNGEPSRASAPRRGCVAGLRVDRPFERNLHVPRALKPVVGILRQALPDDPLQSGMPA